MTVIELPTSWSESDRQIVLSSMESSFLAFANLTEAMSKIRSELSRACSSPTKASLAIEAMQTAVVHAGAEAMDNRFGEMQAIYKSTFVSVKAMLKDKVHIV